MYSILDLSHWNFRLEDPLHEQIDFQKVIEYGVEAIWFKLTQGLAYVDPVAEFLAQGCSANHIPFGYYHYLDARYDGAEQYQIMRDHEPIKPVLPPWLDTEDTFGVSDTKLTNEHVAWLEEAVKDYDDPFTYSNYDFLNNKLQDPQAIREMSRIVFAYPAPTYSEIPANRYPRGYLKSDLKIWQKDWWASIPGIKDHTVDGSVPLDELWFKQLLKNATGVPTIYEVDIFVPKGTDIIKPTFYLGQ